MELHRENTTEKIKQEETYNLGTNIGDRKEEGLRCFDLLMTHRSHNIVINLNLCFQDHRLKHLV